MIDYTQLSPQELDKVLEKNNVYIPRKLRIKVLREVLEPRYLKEKEELEKIQNETPKLLDLMSAFRLKRLKNYRLLSEFQLENDMIYYGDKQLENLFLEKFWKEMSTYIQTLDNAEIILADIDNIQKEKVNIKTICMYNRYFMKRVLDEENYFDGINLVDAVKHFNDTSFESEIRKLGDKYRLDLPKYWKKADLQLRLKKELKGRNLLTPALVEKIDRSSVKEIKVLLEENNLDSKTHITKEDLINIIIKSVDKNKVSVVAKEAEAEETIVNQVIVDNTIKEAISKEKALASDNYADLLRAIIANQEIMIKQNNNLINNQNLQTDYKHNKIFNYIIIFLIIFVVIIWIVYGFKTLL